MLAIGTKRGTVDPILMPLEHRNQITLGIPQPGGSILTSRDNLATIRTKCSTLVLDTILYNFLIFL